MGHPVCTCEGPVHGGEEAVGVARARDDARLVEEEGAGAQFNCKNFGLSLGLKNNLRSHFDTVTYLKYSIFNTLSVGHLKPKFQVGFQGDFQAKFSSIELHPRGRQPPSPAPC